MNHAQIKDSLIALLNGIKNSDGAVIAREMAVLDEVIAAPRAELHPQLEHFLQRRSYAKALAFLGGEDIPQTRVAPRGVRLPPDEQPEKISTDGGEGLGHNPFAGLSGQGLPDAGRLPAIPPQSGTVKSGGGSADSKTGGPTKNRGRVDILREKAGRGGKTVTVVTGWVGIGLPEKEALAKKMQKACGVGGTVKDGRIEIQGDKRDEVARILTEAGFRPVFAGG